MSYADHRALIDQIDTMLHNTSVAVYDATTKQKRKDIDDQITDARIELDKLRSRFEQLTEDRAIGVQGRWDGETA